MRLCLVIFSVLLSLNSIAQQSVTPKNMSIVTKQPPYLKAGDTVAIVAPSGIY